MRNKYTLFLIILTSSLSLGSPALAVDEVDKTTWTMGLGLGAFDYQLYPGADQSKQYILPVPYFTYASKTFEIDQGIKSFLYNGELIVVDVSADFALPVDSDEASARTGMPDLDFMLQLGPSIEFLLNDNKKNYFDVRFETAVRASITTDFRGAENIGYLLEPRFSFNHRRLAKTGVSQKMTVGVKFSTLDLHAYYYDVAAEFVTAERAAYSSSGGYGGAFAKYRISYKSDDFVYWLLLRYQSLHGAVFAESPLVVEKNYYFLGVGFSWVFANSL